MQNKNVARRFILLVSFLEYFKIDEIYNHNVKLYCSAQHDLQNLFVYKKSGETHDEEFALERCKSRLFEM